MLSSSRQRFPAGGSTAGIQKFALKSDLSLGAAAQRAENLFPGSSRSATDCSPPSCDAYRAVVASPERARVEDVHRLAMAMPHVTVVHGGGGNPVYQVGGKSFVFFRTPRPDAVDPVTGARYPDVIMFWVADEADKYALVQDPDSPFFTTAHFDGHPSVLIRGSRLGELTRQELAEIVQDAWLARASNRRRTAWLTEHPVCHGNCQGH